MCTTKDSRGLGWNLTAFFFEDKERDSVNGFQTIFGFIIHQDKKLSANIRVKLSVNRDQMQFQL